MTNRLIKLVWAVALVAVPAMSAARAEAGDIRARIPFDFTVNGKTLAAGTYQISDTQGVLSVRGQSTGAFVTTLGTSSADTRPRLVFDKYGDTYFLRQAWTGAGTGREVRRSARERELARAAGSPVAAAETVVVPAL